MFIEGFIKVGTRTKELVKYLCNEDIAVLQHDDIDELAAEALIKSRIKAIINTGCSMTGKYFSRGTAMLLNNNINIYDTFLDMNAFKDNDYVRIKGRDLIINNNCLFSNSCLPITREYMQQKALECGFSYNSLLSCFIDNTLQFAAQEKNDLLSFADYPELCTNLNGRIVIVVVRSIESMDALLSIKTFIEAQRPVLIGVDGGADTIISCGFIPDILIGDMDSVSDVGIFRSKEVILHAYADGKCPCLDKIKALNIKYKVLAMTGTSEDIALLMSYDKGASNILLIGGHNCMTDFMERGRKGMGSTLITRFKIEDRLIDYKHIVKLMNLVDKSSVLPYSLNEGDMLWMKM